MSDRDKIKRYLRKQMKLIPGDNDKRVFNLKPFDFCYCQAKFDALMDIDMELKLGAFVKRGQVV